MRLLESGSFYGRRLGSLDLSGARLYERSYGRGASPPHAHLHASFCWVIAGTFEQRRRDHVFSCGPGSLLFYPAHAEHREVFGTGGVRCFIVELEAPWLAARGATLPAAPRIGSRDTLCLLARRAHAEYRLRDAVTPLALEGILLELLAAVARDERSPPDRLRRAEEFVRAHFREPIGLAQAAAAAGLSPTALATGFRRRFGRSVGERIRELRVEWVAAQLARAGRPLAELALEAGFADQSHLTRVFRRLLGTTPGRFRPG
jgi:AraC family transcriptional regulator